MLKNSLLVGLCLAVLSSGAAVAGNEYLHTENVNADEEIAIDAAHFPDECFREYVSLLFDSNQDQRLDKDEILNVTSIDISDKPIRTLQGLEYFDNLSFLRCNDTELTALDVSKNVNLRDIDCSYNRIAKLDVSMCSDLESVYCCCNSMTKLILGNNPNMEGIYCYENQITSLDLSGLPALRALYCSGNGISELDFSSNPLLREIDCSMNLLTKVDVSGCRLLTSLSCSDNGITKLDLSKNPYLVNLACYNGGLTSLDVTYCKYLENLACQYNKLSSVDISNCQFLENADFSGNEFKELNLQGFDYLRTVTSFDGHITSVNVNRCPNLQNLDVRGNEVTKLEVSDCPSMEYLHLEANQIKTIDLSKIPSLLFVNLNQNYQIHFDLSKNVKLKEVWCEYDGLTQLDLTSNPNMEYLSCDGNDLKTLDLSKNPKFIGISCKDNPIKSLDLTHCPNLEGLYCDSTLITSLDLSHNPELIHLTCAYDSIKQLDLRTCPNMKFLVETVKPTLSEDGSAYIYEWMEEVESVEECSEEAFVPQEFLMPGYYLVVPKETKLIVEDTNTPAPEKPQPDPEQGASIGDFVERLYTVALGRPSEESGKKYWVNEITNGRKTGGDCGLFFLTGEEFTNRKLSVEDFVETLYKTFFGRASEASGKAYWVGVLKNGGDRTAVIKGFIDSKEWCNLCADYGVRSGAPSAKAERASKKATEFATRLYTCCLGREPEEKGLKYWALALTNLEQTGCSAAKQFFTGAEFVNLKLKNEEYVRRLYTTFMGREPEASEITYWAGEISKGAQTRESVLAFFGQSDEFSHICAKYGIERGSI